uniref:Uncharacterized protein n=1 Tax=Siphoviridae sp. cttFh17 TaxID=2826491 RepID=A0A8S5NJK1_9CAUD|nr:MAG TPA: hypothetical protein [Siphoviridae sp. cttFh17]DAW05629.1 MAG TPA: hypothetical protein [Caudoviricetes sp.]
MVVILTGVIHIITSLLSLIHMPNLAILCV